MTAERSPNSGAAGDTANQSSSESHASEEKTVSSAETVSVPLSSEKTVREWIGRTLGKYRIDDWIGRGGMGVVYRAHDESLGRDVAIKMLPEELVEAANLRERFLSEAKSAAQVNHRHVVSIYEIGQHEKNYFIAMELMTGGNVQALLAGAGARSAVKATEFIADACRGLVAAHQTGLVHRDIKPENLLLSSDGTVKLADFGLAKGVVEHEQTLTRDGQIVGTPHYMSPEQCQAKPVDHRGDIYSLGATFFTLLTAQRPYADAGSVMQIMYGHCHGEPLDPGKLNNNIPPEFANIVLRATAKDPDERYGSSAEMLEALEQALRTHKLESSTETIGWNGSDVSAIDVPPSRAPVNRVRRFVVAAVVATVAVAAVVAAFLLPHTDNDGNGREPAANKPSITPLALGVTEDTITFGTTAAFSGSNEDLGQSMVVGIKTYFDTLNAKGGVRGKKLKLVVLDDGYEPDRALENMRELFERREVFGVIGNVGTPTAKLTVPYAMKQRRLFFAPFTGASFLRKDPPDRYLYHYRAGYADETAAIVRYFVEQKGIAAGRIAVFAQSDSFGDDGFRGVTDALRSYGVLAEDVLRVGYERNSIRVDEAVATLLQQRDQVGAVIMVSTYKPAARFVQKLKDQGAQMRFAALSFVGSRSLVEEFREIGVAYADGLIVTQVVPHFRSNATGVILYRDMLEKYHPEAHPGFVSLEGFIAAQCLVEGLKRVEGQLTNEGLVDALDGIQDLDLGIGPIISFGPSRHQASDRVWGTVFDATGELLELDLTRP